MKYINTLALAVIVAVGASCAQAGPEFAEKNTVQSGQKLTLTASWGDPETRTERAADGAVLWSPGDQISLFYGSGDNGGSCFTGQNTEPSKVVNFTGEIGVITGGNDVAVEDTYFWAVYPYNPTASCNGSSITTVLPAAQIAKADTFADDLFPSVGRSQGLVMGFYNICGGLKFTTSEEGIKSVTLQGHNNEIIAGTMTVGFDDAGQPVVLGIADGSDTITVSAPQGETFEVGKAYYIVLVPTVFENGFTLTFSKGYARATYDRTKKTTIRRSAFGGLTTPDAGLEWFKDSQYQLTLEREALIAFYNALGGDNWLNNENWCSDKPVTEWYGIQTNEEQFVTGINLCSNNLNGCISDDLLLFEHLESLSLSFNDNLSGTLPEAITESEWFAYQWGNILPGTKLKSNNIPAPDFSVIDLENKSIESSGIYNTEKLLITCEWHPDAVDIFNFLIPYYSAYKDKGLSIIGIIDSYTESSYLQNKQNFPWPVVKLDGNQNKIITGCTSYPCNYRPNITVIDCNNRCVVYSSTLSPSYDISSLVQQYFPNTSSLNGGIPPQDEIWYISTTGEMIDPNNGEGFGASIVSNQVIDRIGIIKFDGTVSAIPDRAFMGNKTIQEISLPDTIEKIGVAAFGECSYLRFIHIPESTVTIEKDAFYGLSAIDNKTLTLPPSLKSIDEWAFAQWTSIEQLILPDGIESIGWCAFLGCSSLITVTIPESVLHLVPNAFCSCSSIISFSGRYATNDGLGLIVESSDDSSVIFGQYALANPHCLYYEIPSRVTHLAGGCFSGSKYVKKIKVPEGVPNIPWQCFLQSTVEEVILPESLESIGEEAFRLSNLCKIIIPKGVTQIYDRCFMQCQHLEEVEILAEIEEIPAGAFSSCSSLKNIIIPESVIQIDWDGLSYNDRLTEIFCRAAVPPRLINTHYLDQNYGGALNKYCVIFVPSQSLALYKSAPGWSAISEQIVGYDYGDLALPDYYVSTDMSHDGEVIALQQSTIGEGINLILMGDGFSDRQIADDTYDTVMRNAMSAFFSEEPYKTFKECFNVSYVNVVSMTEGYDHAGQALGTGFGDGSYVFGNDSKVIEYAKKAVSEDKLDDVLIIVMVNKDAYAGTCYMYDAPGGNYGRGLSIAYFPTSSDTATFNGLVSHEAGGHGFAKLADEYAYEYLGAVPQNVVESAHRQETWGWWKNIDFTNDLTQIKWSQFINDSRYAGENIGCYEGGYTYWSGVWRPTEDSIMRYNTGGFNAPSRYAIWYRINKLAYGDNWSGTYEDFVAYDAMNRTPAASARRAAQRRNCVEKNRPLLAPPVIVGHSWRDAK